MQSKTKVIAGLIVAAVGACAVLYGAGTVTVQVTGCKAVVKQYVLAHFAEDYTCIETGIDFDGNPYTEVDTCTRRWTEYASPIITTTTVNGEGAGPLTYQGYYYAYPPKVRTKWDHDPNFEEYSDENNVVITKQYSNGSSMLDNKYLACLVSLDSSVTIRTLYGVNLWEID